MCLLQLECLCLLSLETLNNIRLTSQVALNDRKIKLKKTKQMNVVWAPFSYEIVTHIFILKILSCVLVKY